MSSSALKLAFVVFIFTLLLCCAVPAYAQYEGGSYDGYSSAAGSDVTLGTKAVTISSAKHQVFMVSASTQAIAPILITDTDGGMITASDATGDIRINIPSGLSMVWGSSDGTATLGGSAASKCSSSVVYEDSDKTLKVNVSSDFTAGDTLVVSGVSFGSFSAASSADSLRLEIANQGVYYAFDNKKIVIIADSGVAFTGGSGDGYSSSVSGDYQFGKSLRLEGLKIEGMRVE